MIEMNTVIQNPKPDSTAQISKVTKNAGRVAAGKKLVAWNKQKKINKIAKENIQVKEEINDNESPNQQHHKSDGYLSLNNLGFTVIGVRSLSYLGYILYKKNMKNIKQKKKINNLKN